MTPAPNLPPLEFLETPPAHRPPDWRYQQAAADAERDRFRLPVDADPMLRQMTYCLWRLKSARTDRERRYVESLPRFRPLVAALRIALDREQAAPLETLVLARRMNKKNASQLRLPKSVVKVYKALFFDVRRLMSDIDYILRYAIAPERRLGDPDTARSRTGRKALAFFCGPMALDKLTVFDPPQSPDSWRSPAEIVRGVSVARTVERVGDLLTDSTAIDAAELAAEIDSLEEVLETAASSGTYPRHLLAYMVQSGLRTGLDPSMAPPGFTGFQSPLHDGDAQEQPHAQRS